MKCILVFNGALQYFFKIVLVINTFTFQIFHRINLKIPFLKLAIYDQNHQRILLIFCVATPNSQPRTWR